MAKKQFKTESKKLLDLMINSIYTHKEIFLRELISNASDALDKLYYKSLTDSSIKKDFQIDIKLDKQNRLLYICDNGIGMTKEELDTNLGTIAKSGSFDFKNQTELNDVDIIGQFGVGFYSSFMVADTVSVTTKSYDEEKAYKWSSSGISGYLIEDAQKQSHGTCITLHLKEDTDEENYSQYLEEYTIKGLIKKHSDYIRYPIKMECTKTREKKDSKEGEDKFETYKEIETLNSMIPVWKKSKNELSEGELNEFYKNKFNDFADPARVIRSKTEGAATYNAMLFIPSHPPFDYYTKDYEKGLQLYSSGVLIMEKCDTLLCDYFSFVKGLVDSEDLSLNISRETLQQDRQLKLIEKSLEKKIKNELSLWLKNDRASYEEFFKNFGVQLKFGMYCDYGVHKDVCKDLVLFISSKEHKYVTLEEYVSSMKQDQKEIYYVCGKSIESITSMPQLESFVDRGIEVLFLTDNIDEFAIKMLESYKDKHFKNIADHDLDIEDDTIKTKLNNLTQKNKELLEFMKNKIKDYVEDIRLTGRLKSGAVCLSSSGDMSIEMEKILNAMPNSQNVKAKRILEINPDHNVFLKLVRLYENGEKDKVAEYTELLYTQATLMEGIMPTNLASYTQKICDLMAQN